LRHTLVDQRGEWQQRMQAVLYHHGLPKRAGLLTGENRAWVEQLPLTDAAREQIEVALAMIDAVDVQVAPLDRGLRSYARRQAGCKAIQAHYGIGPLTSVVILAELGDTRRFSSSREAVRYSGLDITVHASDKRRAPGHLSRQGPPVLRWALYEAAQTARRKTSPDYAYYQQAAERLGDNRALLSVMRKLLKRSYHTLRELGDDALAPLTNSSPCAPGLLTITDAPRPAPDNLLPPRPRGRPAKTERPQLSTQREQHPINHHVTGREPNPQVADRDKPGRPRAHHPANSASTRVAGAVTRPGSHRTVRTLFVYGSSGRRVMTPAAGRLIDLESSP
jgi:hypothetical protein